MARPVITEAIRHQLSMQVRGVNGGMLVSIQVSQLRELLINRERMTYLEGRNLALEHQIAEREGRITAARRALKGNR